MPPVTPLRPLGSAPLAAAASQDARVRFTEAVQQFEGGEDDAARAAFLVLLDHYAALEDYHLTYLARIEERAGHLPEAAEFFERLLASHDRSVWVPLALAQLAWVRLSLGDPQAFELAARALETPNVAPNERALALLVQAEGHASTAPREAYLLYQEVRGLGRSQAAGLARDRSTALERAHPALLTDPQLALAEGRVRLKEGRLDGATERLEAAALAADPETRAEALRALARVQRLQGREEEAIATYQGAAQVEPPPGGTAYFDLATMLWNRDRDQEAAEVFGTLLRENPEHPKRDTARYALARIAEQEGRSAEAERLYRDMIARGSDGSLMRDARWRLTWMAYRDGRLDAAHEELAALANVGAPDRPAALYWQGRVQERNGDPSGAAETFVRVLEEAPDTYYAGLSEQRLGRTLPPPPLPTPLSMEPPPSLTAHAYHWDRSQELRAAGQDGLATRELDALARELFATDGPDPFLLEAYRSVGAHDRALRLAARIARGADPTPPSLAFYLYPQAYWSVVVTQADAQDLDPYLVMALMRQESAFDPDAVSPAAAHGLMQLLVRTARSVADVPLDAQALSDPTTNIRLGTRYLRRLMDRYAGDLPKTLAAYNAGAGAVAKWDARYPGASSDEFVENISFRETRAYVKTVLANYRRYRRLYGGAGEVSASQPALAARGPS